jgi:glutamine amidotransferase
LPGSTQHLRPLCTRVYKVPHMGWNTLELSSPKSQLLDGILPEKRCFFFSNAYAIPPNYHQLTVQATYTHELPWLGLLEHGNIFGVQFHPEKSRQQGLHLLHNFLKIVVENT